MKRIGIDARLYFQTGVGVYLRNFLYHLQHIKTDYQFYVYVLSSDSPKIFFHGNHIIKREVPYKWHTVSEQLGFLRTLYQDKLDLMHFTYFSYPVLYRRPFIATIHDTIILGHKTGKASTKHPFFYSVKHLGYQFAIKQQLAHATAVITPSKSVKEDILRRVGKQYTSKIHPIYEGVDRELINTKENSSLENKIPKNYMLYVGNFYPHKNVSRLIEAFLKTSIDCQLILVGPNDFFCQRMKRQVEEQDTDKRIMFYTNASEEDKVYLYKHAQALIHPSLEEGFGLPLVEAIYFDLPIIASNIPVYKELLGTHYVAFDPLSVQDMSEKIRLCHEGMRRDINRKELLNQFSFEAMTKSIYSMYEKYL
jgi:glycosyltransferase involved in cell wall biosynthesis